MFYDLFKFQYFFNEAKAEVGIEIVPAHHMHKADVVRDFVWSNFCGTSRG